MGFYCRRLALPVALSVSVLFGGCAPPSAASIDAATHDSAPTVDSAMAESGVDASSVEACVEPGALRPGTCGRCGMATERCVGGTWLREGPCIGEGECSAAATETRQSVSCATEARICMANCTWSDWDVIEPGAGVCVAGDTRDVPDGCAPGVAQHQSCSDVCAWVEAGCVDACGGQPRTSPAYSEESCVPAGPYVRGDPGERGAGDVFVSSFYIDRYPVTVDRYRRCVEAGVCTPPADAAALESFNDPSRGSYPMPGANWDQAMAFCAWDGGRRLPTEAEWEKAARGPSPRQVLYPWGDATDCSVLQTYDCGAIPSLTLPDPVDGLPATASFYGVEMLVGGGYEWVHDWYDGVSGYYFGAVGTADPQGPAVGDLRMSHGATRSNQYWSGLTIRRRSGGRPETSTWANVFRCARSE